jgi:hypothetical protein
MEMFGFFFLVCFFQMMKERRASPEPGNADRSYFELTENTSCD